MFISYKMTKFQGINDATVLINILINYFFVVIIFTLAYFLFFKLFTFIAITFSRRSHHVILMELFIKTPKCWNNALAIF